MRIKFLTTLFSLFVLCTSHLFSQGQYNNWYFSYFYAISFNSGSPVIINGSAMASDECSATISDASGNLLFYTNGNSIWDRNNNLMPNGTGILSVGDVQQSVLIVPLPNNNNLYYVFSIGGTSGLWPRDLRYSIVDMSLNNSMGDVTLKNILLDSDVTEKLTATMHVNGNDIWVIDHPYTSHQFKSYLLTSGGITTTVLSNVGPKPYNLTAYTGAIRISNNGCWLLSTYRFTNLNTGLLELYHFNNSTGMVSGGTTTNLPNPWGLEFSPDNTKFYISQNTLSPIYQFDLQAGSDSLILASYTAVSDTIQSTFNLQIAPDNKIYFSGPVDTLLGVIEHPNNIGWVCGVNTSAIVFHDTIGGSISLPNNFNLVNHTSSDCHSNAIIENDEAGINIFPNPFSNQISVSIAKQNPKQLSYTISNILGQIVYGPKEINPNDTFSKAIDLGFLSSGMYFLEINLEGERIVKKILKE
jgi:hypothetical protein